MKKIFSIAKYTFIENMRNKVFYIIILFGIIIVGSSLLLSALGGEQSRRILLDVGLGAIEFFALITVGFASVTLVLEEMESKTIYLIFARPVSRISYLLGRYVGLLSAVYFGMILMSMLHLLILYLKGFDIPIRYFWAFLLCGGKICIIGSVALFFSLFSTSAVSSISFTVFFWILGHFSEEISFLSSKISNIWLKMFMKAIYYLIPNMQYFNLRDFWDVPQISGIWIPLAMIYGLVYSIFFICLSLWMFKYKEF